MAVVFHGRYSWDGTKVDSREPISWYPGSCDLTIIDLGQLQEGITQLRPFLCLFVQGNQGHSISVNPEKFAQRICADFSLCMDKVLWVEVLDQRTQHYSVISFRQTLSIGPKTLYTYSRRAPMAGEQTLIQQHVQATEPMARPRQANRTGHPQPV
jgi:hypothetical protein